MQMLQQKTTTNNKQDGTGREGKARGWIDRMGHIEVCVCCKFMVLPRQRERREGHPCPEHTAKLGECQERTKRTNAVYASEEALFSLVCPFFVVFVMSPTGESE